MTDQTNKLFECYVANPTHDEAVEIVERLIANGAWVHDAVDDMGVEGGAYHDFDCWPLWGYNSKENGTYTNGFGTAWANRSKQLTMQEFRAAFPCDKYDSTTEEWPQSGDRVVVTEDEVKSDAIFIGKSPSGAYVCQMSSGWAQGLYDGFRKDVLSKPKSDREKFVEAAVKALEKWPVGFIPDNEVLGDLYDAGFKAPEAK